ncbi:hypothetical protein QEH68_21005 [Paenarthrobacter sp. OM7]|uniref:Uncharacterized protein n=1 Tax=Paenarthrobacter sp. AMU7 TaxID=3162492 RepID=A0AB39YPC5_9MICC|nr:hypothetical protein [Paenarthrobacter sp. OM7]WGM20462.1 hypothetical protein QEH68_21005 [Paenarthrobacter sp. OM7]
MLATREQELSALHAEHFSRSYQYIAYRINGRERDEELANDGFRIVWESNPRAAWPLMDDSYSPESAGQRMQRPAPREEFMARMAEEARASGTASDDG